MDAHQLKTLPEYFEAVLNKTKNFEVRKNDRDFKVGDILNLREWDGKEYTGRETFRRVIYILYSSEYCKEGFVILGIL